MYRDKKVLAIIPARGGSKGIPGKNIVNVCGKPLIQYTIDAAKASRYIDYVYVSTDSEKIAMVSRECGIDVTKLRPSELATDEAKTIDVIKYTLNLFNEDRYDYVVLLQPTQPLRQAKHIDEAIEMIVPGKCESIVSVSEVNEHPLFMRKINAEGKLESILVASSTVRRQELGAYYKVNGAIYINNIEELLQHDVSLNDNVYPFVMEKEFDLDIDEQNDLNKLIEIVASTMNTCD